MTTHTHTSAFVSVRMEVEPKSVLHTSPDTLAEAENMLSSRYPNAIEPTENMAKAASPFIFVLVPVLRRSTAQSTVTGRTIMSSVLTDKTAAIAIAPKATWERPSPINE